VRLANPKIERGYFVIERHWRSGDAVVLDLPMPVRRVAASPNVVESRGMLALARGPLVYCLEQTDNPSPIAQAAIPPTSKLEVVDRPELLGGVKLIQGEALAGSGEWKGGLYGAYSAPTLFKFTAIPYYAWDNRQPGAMRVWMPVLPPAPEIHGLERSAKVSLSNVTGLCKPESVRNGIEPKSSADHPGDLCHFWPRKGTGDDWIRYDWPEPVTLTSARVYWFDDTGFGECRIPVSWKLEYLDGGAWKPVEPEDAESGFPVALDRWCEVSFRPVSTKALRLSFAMKPNWSVGIHEWRVYGNSHP
jgi:hypothetical protein